MTEPEKLIPKPVGDIWAVSSRGQTKGHILVPHRNQRGKFAGAYIASMTRFESDYVPVRDPDQLREYVARGYGIRMSPQDTPGRGNLIIPVSIQGWHKSEGIL
jgi:hypothetical protein